MERITWSADAVAHIRVRSDRYGARAVGIEPEWTEEVLADPLRIVEEPFEKSMNPAAVRIIGYSQTAGFVIGVVALRVGRNRLHGQTAYKASGAVLRDYLKGDQE